MNPLTFGKSDSTATPTWAIFASAAVAVVGAGMAWAGNPIVDGRGLTDPHATVFGDRVYLYATHDFSPDNKSFVMKDWWVWSSSNLVEWKLESTLKPEDTFIRKPFNSCWATFGVGRNGKYYWYFSAGPEEIGVVVGDSPAGPWTDPLGKPLIAKGLTPTKERDPDLLVDDDGAVYIVYGTFDYFIARLNEDMISLAKPPRPVHLDRKYGPYGEGKTDDKPSLHKRNGVYYLSWSSFYATADNVYGPYTYKGSVIDSRTVAPEFQTANLFNDRHGNFFTFHNQTYYVCNDKSQPGRSAHFRDAILTYAHYRDNGEIAPVRIDRLGVGQYDATRGRIEAEDYFAAVNADKRERPRGHGNLAEGFEMRISRSGGNEADESEVGAGGYLVYPNVHNLPRKAMITLRVATARSEGVTVEIRERTPEGRLFGVCPIPNTGGWHCYRAFTTALDWGDSTEAGDTTREKDNRGTRDPLPLTKDLCFVFKGPKGELCRLDWFLLSEMRGR